MIGTGRTPREDRAPVSEGRGCRAALHGTLRWPPGHAGAAPARMLAVHPPVARLPGRPARSVGLGRADHCDDRTGVASGMKRCAIFARCRSEMRRATSLEAQIRNRRQFGAQRGWTILVGDGASERRGPRITTREQGSEAAWRVPACQRRLVQPRLLADEPRMACLPGGLTPARRLNLIRRAP